MNLTDTIGVLLKSKGENRILSIEPARSVFEAIEKMAQHGVGALLVISEHRLIGIVSERDYARKVILKGRSSRDTPVSENMTPAPLCVSPNSSVDECMRLCTDRRVRHLPVVDGGKIVGVVSIGDLVKAVIDDQAVEIDQLQRYIAG